MFIDLIEPFPIRDILKIAYKAIRKNYGFITRSYKAEKMVSELIRNDINRVSSLKENWKIQSDSINEHDLTLLTEGRFNQIYKQTLDPQSGTSDIEYFIKQDNNFYRVRWDDGKHT